MRFNLLIEADITPAAGGVPPGEAALRESLRLAVVNAVQRGAENGYEHPLSIETYVTIISVGQPAAIKHTHQQHD